MGQMQKKTYFPKTAILCVSCGLVSSWRIWSSLVARMSPTSNFCRIKTEMFNNFQISLQVVADNLWSLSRKFLQEQEPVPLPPKKYRSRSHFEKNRSRSRLGKNRSLSWSHKKIMRLPSPVIKLIHVQDFVSKNILKAKDGRGKKMENGLWRDDMTSFNFSSNICIVYTLGLIFMIVMPVVVQPSFSAQMMGAAPRNYF